MEYYLYRHIRLDKNEPFYIGIGKKKKHSPKSYSAEYHRAHVKTKRNKWWHKIVNKTDYEIEILYESNSKDEICEKEKEFIKLYGRRDLGLGPLVNLTNGGDFFDGYIPTEEDRLKKSKALMGKTVLQESVTKMVNTRRERGNYKWSQESKNKMSNVRLGKKLSKESIEKRESTRKENAIKRGFYLTQESMDKKTISHRNTRFPEERINKIIELYLDKKSISFVTKELKVAHRSVVRILKENNIL